jgi:hypothetical protein
LRHFPAETPGDDHLGKIGYRGPPGVEKEIVYVVQSEASLQEVLTPVEFVKKYGWKNDPDKSSSRATNRGA